MHVTRPEHTPGQLNTRAIPSSLTYASFAMNTGSWLLGDLHGRTCVHGTGLPMMLDAGIPELD